MKYKLINQPNPSFSAQEQILFNRGIKTKEEIKHYMNLTDADINSPEAFGEELLKFAAIQVHAAIDTNKEVCVVVDADCDGYTSSAILINYLYDLNPVWVENHVHWYMHTGKQHGLADCMDWIEDMGAELVIVPDGGTNDTEQLNQLQAKDIEVIILDHHEVEVKEYWSKEKDNHPHILLINSQLPPYPNDQLSGAGVVYQFCKYLDKFFKVCYADQYLDLCALGLVGDMMSLTSYETRRLITKGINPDSIRNPFIYEMWRKNVFKLTETPTAWGFTFYIVPFVNAITRSGEQEEKELIFDSMLKFKAFKQIPSNKRGHKLGEMERAVDQAIRTCTNVKARQGRSEDAGLNLVEHLIKDNNMMDHKILLFLLEPGQIKAEIRGLIANKIQAKYQRPCCMLTKCIKRYEEPTIEYSRKAIFPILHCVGEEYITYEGSARGCDRVGVTEFKDICTETQVCEYTVGHQGAFGLGLPENKIDEFLSLTDSALVNMPNEPIYYVDYIWDMNNVDAEAVLEIGEMDQYIGKNMEEPIVAIRGLQITKDMISMMKSNTVKISLPNGVSIIKFNMPDEEYNKLVSENGYVQIDIVGVCAINEWNGNRFPQIKLTDYEITGGCAYIF